jgi:hypothetical protein
MHGLFLRSATGATVGEAHILSDQIIRERTQDPLGPPSSSQPLFPSRRPSVRCEPHAGPRFISLRDLYPLRPEDSSASACFHAAKLKRSFYDHNDCRKSLHSHILLTSKKLTVFAGTGGRQSRSVSVALCGTFQSGCIDRPCEGLRSKDL